MESVLTSTPTAVQSEEATAPSDVVSAEVYMEHYAAERYEWVKGELIKMSPVSLIHDQLLYYIRNLLQAYLSLNPIGHVIGDPFVMRLDALEARRQPDLEVIFQDNPGTLTATAMIGPADICVEVVSRGSVATDYGAKFEEYEKGGVREYWLIDPIRKVCYFRRLNSEDLYEVQPVDTHYTTPLLPQFTLHVPTLWEKELPNIIETVEAVKGMFE